MASAGEQQACNPSRVAERKLLSDHPTHRGAYYLSSGHACRIQNRHRIGGHLGYPVWGARYIAAPDPAIIEYDNPVASLQARQNAKPHFVAKAKTHNEQDWRSGAILLPVNSDPLICCVWHGINPQYIVALRPPSAIC